jgi:hypothetical protein
MATAKRILLFIFASPDFFNGRRNTAFMFSHEDYSINHSARPIRSQWNTSIA